MSSVDLNLSDYNSTSFNPSNISEAEVSTNYVIKEINSIDDELKSFLFSLGCYKGETVTLISSFKDNFVINIKDARYSIDKDLAEAILI